MNKTDWNELSLSQKEREWTSLVTEPHAIHRCDNFVGCNHSVFVYLDEHTVLAHHDGVRWEQISA